ncbi:unnamed protein product [Blepharisma stoltei]|uniref:Cyclin-like domain-containing protein n=1 Tax=Blepharisma stoltei TaxID=1481888 RepID=A0AAU9IK15_9CILI|nr:unnamed protein product [Blepharisma stoltei]
MLQCSLKNGGSFASHIIKKLQMQAQTSQKIHHKRHISHATSSFLKEYQLSQLSTLYSPKATEENTFSNSTTSGNSSPHPRLECEETLNFPIQTFPHTENSFTSDIYGNQSLDYQQVLIENPNLVPYTLWKPQSIGYMYDMLEKETIYLPNAGCFESLQAYVTPVMRAVLFDWMMEVSHEFMLKRETFYMALSYVDRILSKLKNIKKEEFQLLGVACLNIAAKIEEIYPPKLSDWVSSCNSGYSSKAIKMTEKFVLQQLTWLTYPATSYNWLNWLMSQWDDFIEYHFSCVPYNSLKDFDHLPTQEKKIQKKLYEKRFIIFKQKNRQAYKRFRETFQILDTASLDSEIMKLSPRIQASGLLYLMISKFFFETNYNLLYYDGPVSQDTPSYEDSSQWLAEGSFDIEEFSSDSHIESASIVQDLYAGFISSALDMHSVEEIYHSMTFFHPYLEIEALYEFPIVVKAKGKRKIESHYEEFLGYQTHYPEAIKFVTKKLRGE